MAWKGMLLRAAIVASRSPTTPTQSSSGCGAGSGELGLQGGDRGQRGVGVSAGAAAGDDYAERVHRPGLDPS